MNNELTFKRTVSTSYRWGIGRLNSDLFFVKLGEMMDIFIYSDESGVFDKIHNKYFIFAGIVLLSKEEKDDAVRKYKKIEKNIRKSTEKYY